MLAIINQPQTPGTPAIGHSSTRFLNIKKHMGFRTRLKHLFICYIVHYYGPIFPVYVHFQDYLFIYTFVLFSNLFQPSGISH